MSRSEPVEVRSARPGEEPALLDLWRRAGAEPSATDDLESIHGLLERWSDGVLVADDDGLVVGSVLASWDGWRGNLYRLAVLPEHRRQGIARALVEAGEQRLRALGCRRISALVMREHEGAVGFWAAARYEADERIVRFVRTLPDPLTSGSAGGGPADPALGAEDDRRP